MVVLCVRYDASTKKLFLSYISKLSGSFVFRVGKVTDCLDLVVVIDYDTQLSHRIAL